LAWTWKQKGPVMNFLFKQGQMDKNGISLEFVYTQCIDMNVFVCLHGNFYPVPFVGRQRDIVCESKHTMPTPSFQDFVFLIPLSFKYHLLPFLGQP
jgi:hypothetical protein